MDLVISEFLHFIKRGDDGLWKISELVKFNKNSMKFWGTADWTFMFFLFASLNREKTVETARSTQK